MTPKVALTIAGSDSSGGAGILADVNTFGAFGVRGVCAITAVTAQSTIKVEDIHPLPPPFVSRQIETTLEDIKVHAAKTGMLVSAPIINAVAESLRRLNVENIVVDPVLTASSGGRLLAPDAVSTLKEKIFPMAHAVTPNIPEAEVLSQVKITGVDSMKGAAKKIYELGPQNVIVTGGHLEGKSVVDVLLSKGEFHLFERKRIDNPNTHGSGCVFSAAITAQLAKGVEIVSAVEKAGEFIEKAILQAEPIGKGRGPVNPLTGCYK